MILDWFNNKKLFYEDILRELHEKKIRYLLVGGTAVALHGVVRLTADIDIMLSLDIDNVKNFIAVMKGLRYKPKVPVDALEFADPEKRKEWITEKNMRVFAFHHLDKPLETVDVFVDNPIDFEELYKKKVIKKAKGMEIPIVSIDDLIELKKMAGRPQDLVDIEKLQEVKKLI